MKNVELKIDDTIRIIYYTLGFKSEFTFNNLITQEYTPSREFYKLNNNYLNKNIRTLFYIIIRSEQIFQTRTS